MACQYQPPWYLRVMFDLWMSNFDVGTVLLPARRLYLFHYLVLSVKTVVKRAKKSFLQAG